MAPSYKRVNFTDLLRNNPLNVVTYVVYPGKQIVFTGLHNCTEGPAGSSINYAEDIVYAIAAKERIDPQDVTFFDLQTMKGYIEYLPGDYRFNRLVPSWENRKIVHMEWREGHCTDTILHDFAGYIQGSDATIKFRNLAQAYGAIKPLQSANNLNTLQDVIDLVIAVNDTCDKHALKQLREVFTERLGKIVKSYCLENNVDPMDNDGLILLAKDTPLGPKSAEHFCETCAWILEQHLEFRQLITPILFIE